MKNEILTLPNNILRMKAQAITNFGSTELKELVDRLFAVMQEKDGVGLAAPQLGISQRIFVYGFDSSPRYPNIAGVPKGYAINPEIIWQSDETIDQEEGCLSVPHQRGLVSRSKTVTFSCQDIHGKRHEHTFHDFAARIILHETDHLNGVLYVDRAKTVHNTELY